jgi:hypothetical protein
MLHDMTQTTKQERKVRRARFASVTSLRSGGGRWQVAAAFAALRGRQCGIPSRVVRVAQNQSTHKSTHIGRGDALADHPLDFVIAI